MREVSGGVVFSPGPIRLVALTLKRGFPHPCQTLKTIPFACIFGAASG